MDGGRQRRHYYGRPVNTTRTMQFEILCETLVGQSIYPQVHPWIHLYLSFTRSGMVIPQQVLDTLYYPVITRVHPCYLDPNVNPHVLHSQQHLITDEGNCGHPQFPSSVSSSSSRTPGVIVDEFSKLCSSKVLVDASRHLPS